MFFVLKCAFWLALVYAAMLLGFGPSRPVSSDTLATKTLPTKTLPTKTVSVDAGADLARVGRAAMRAAVGGASTGLATLCAHRAADCLAEAGRLTALFDASGAVEPVMIGPAAAKVYRGGSDREVAMTVDHAASAEVPMPVADPRRRTKVSRLTPKS